MMISGYQGAFADADTAHREEPFGPLMKETILDRLASVKSIVTVLLTGVFGYLAVTGGIDGTEFLTVFTVVISFYFGTQSQKVQDVLESKENGNGD